jgi:hypothetical protein
MFKGKKSLGSTRRDLHALLDYQGREDAMTWWSRAEDEMKTAEISSVGMTILCSIAFALANEDTEVGAGFMVIARAGYALRLTLPEVTSRIARMDVAELDVQALRTVARRPTAHPLGMPEAPDYDEFSEALTTAGAVAATYGDDERFGALASVDVEFWLAVLSLATYQFHKNIGRLDQALVATLVQLGFVTRALEEAVGIASHGSWAPLPAAEPPTTEARLPSGSPLDLDVWQKDASLVATNLFEPFTEWSLDRSVVELFGFQTIVDGIFSGKPWRGDVPAVEFGIANARFGYALRNLETQVIDCYGHTIDGDPLAELGAHRKDNRGVPVAVAHTVVQEVVTTSATALYDLTLGTTADLRRRVMRKWVDDHCGSEDRHFAAIEHGYFLHRLFEIEPSYLRKE